MPLIDPLFNTAQQDTDLAIADIVARFPELDASRSGTLVNAIAGVVAIAKRDAQRFALREVAKTFFQTAEGTDLDDLADDHLQLSRLAASTAIGQVLVIRTAPAPDATIPAGTILIDSTGAEFTVTADTPITTTAALAPVLAPAAGTSGNRTAFTVFSPKTALGADFPGVSLYNPEPIAGGNAAETDPEFRARIAQWWRALRRATTGAIEFVALSVDTIRRAVVDETHIRPENGGWVDLYVTDANDQYNTLLLDAVRAAVDRDARAAGVVVNVHGAEVVTVPIRVALTQRAGGPAAAASRAATAILDFVNRLPIGAQLNRSRIAAVAVSADSSLLNAQVLAPAADLVTTSRQVIRTSASQITIQ